MAQNSKTTDDLFLKKWELNKLQQAILRLSLGEEFKKGFINNIDKDFNQSKKSSIEEVKEKLQRRLEVYFSREEFFKRYSNALYDFEEYLKQLSYNGPINTRICKIECEKLIKLVDEYIKFGNVKDSEKFFNEALAELKKCKDELTFERVAAKYGCRAENDMGYVEFNEFLRTHMFPYCLPAQYAEYLRNVNALRKGIKKHNCILDKPITVYRYMSDIGFLRILKDAKIIDNARYKKLIESSCFSGDSFCKEVLSIVKNKKIVIQDLGFMSTSKNSTSTADMGGGVIKFIIDVKPGTAVAADITKLSGHSDQEEVLFYPGQKLRLLEYNLLKKEISDFIIFIIEIKAETVN